ncbi:MAG: beta-propeller fold lactonase family protein [Candidatus Cybelea sp.]
MRLSSPVVNRASIVMLAGLLAGCSSTSPETQALPLGSSGATQHVVRPRGATDNAVQFAYVVNFGSNNLSAYSIAAGGALTPLAGSPFSAGTEPYGLAIDPTGKFAYVNNFGSSNISAYAIDATSGALKNVKGSPFGDAGANPLSVAVEPSGKFAYVANYSSNNISAYAIDATSGALTPIAGSPFGAGTKPYAIAIDPTGKFVYVANVDSDDVYAYAIDATTGALTRVKGSPFRTGVEPISVTVDPMGKFVYVAALVSDDIYAFSIDAASGALRPLGGSPFAEGYVPKDVVIDPTGRFAYAPNNGDRQEGASVSAYSIDSTRGTLTPVAGSPFKDGSARSNPITGAVDSTSKLTYITNEGSNNILVYTIAASGALRKVKGSPFAAGTGPVGIAVCRVTAGKCIPPPL